MKPSPLFLSLAAAGPLAGVAGARDSDARKREGFLSALPSEPGPHLEKSKALAEGAWLNLGAPAADPQWGKARGRSWSCRMAFASKLRGAFLACVASHGALAEDASQPGEVLAEPATLHCLAVRWPLKGDANENAVIEVQYRRTGDREWRRGFPLVRTFADPHPQNPTPAVRVAGGRMFAGSIVDLAPATAYEVKLALHDPDGGSVEKTLAMQTITEPREPAGMRVRHVAPGEGGGTGAAGDPLRGLPAAFAAAEAGDCFLIHKGTYPVQSALEVKVSGTAAKPIIFRGAGDGEVVIDGGGTHATKGRLISGNATGHVWLEDLILQGRQYLVVAHESSHWVIRRCTFREMEKGFTAQNGGYEVSRGHFIADNTFIGGTHWPRTKGIEGFAGIGISGAGHVVAYNRMEKLGDGVHGTGHGNLSASDFYNNDISVCTDDGIETDYAETNVRVFRNRIANVAHGVTAQPAMGGPIYIFRNLIYNATHSPFKLHNHTTGVRLFHNTSLRHGGPFVIQPSSETVTNVWSRNNLFLGTASRALHTTGRMRLCNFDSDGYGGFTEGFAVWNGRTYKTADDARADGVIYHERGALLLDPNTLFATGLQPPSDPSVEYKISDLDLRLKAAAGAVDAGVVIPNFNDAFDGKAPDLGALELHASLPHYGPRPSQPPRP